MHAFLKKNIEPGPSEGFFLGRHVVREIFRCERSGAARVPGDIDEIEPALEERFFGEREIFLGLSRESDDDIGRDGKEGIAGAEVIQLGLEVAIGMLAVHRLQYPVRSGLEGEVEVRAERWDLEVCVQDVSGHVVRIGTREADPVDPFDVPEFVQEFPKRRFFPGNMSVPGERFRVPELRLRFLSVAVYVLSKERDFADSGLRELADFGDDLVLRSGDFPTPRVGDDAE